jgi:sugar/nucleoside kinase (ribokinase family)
MPPATELLHERPYTQLRVHTAAESLQNKGYLFVGETTIVRHPTIIPEIQTSQMLTREAFNEFHASVRTIKPVASNPGFDIGRRLTRLGKEPVTLLTWGNAEHTSLMKAQIGRPYRGMDTSIQRVEGDMREAVVFEIEKDNCPERIEISTPAATSSNFIQALNGTRHVIIGGLPEGSWRTSLENGFQRLQKKPYTMLLGDAFRQAVVDNKGSQIVYDAIESATSLIVTLEDLKLLIQKHRTAQTPSDKLSTLMEQARILGPQYIFAVCGREGFIGGSTDETFWIHANRGKNIVYDNAYMNAFIAGVVSGNDLGDSLLRGSASTSLLVERGVQSTPPTEEELQTKMDEKGRDGDVHMFSS